MSVIPGWVRPSCAQPAPRSSVDGTQSWGKEVRLAAIHGLSFHQSQPAPSHGSFVLSVELPFMLAYTCLHWQAEPSQANLSQLGTPYLGLALMCILSLRQSHIENQVERHPIPALNLVFIGNIYHNHSAGIACSTTVSMALVRLMERNQTLGLDTTKSTHYMRKCFKSKLSSIQLYLQTWLMLSSSNFGESILIRRRILWSSILILTYFSKKFVFLELALKID